MGCETFRDLGGALSPWWAFPVLRGMGFQNWRSPRISREEYFGAAHVTCLLCLSQHRAALHPSHPGPHPTLTNFSEGAKQPTQRDTRIQPLA